MLRFTLALSAIILFTASLQGCGRSMPVAPAVRPATIVAAQGLDPKAYQPATLDQLSSFWDREGSAANDGKRFQVVGAVHANPPGMQFVEGWSATLSGPKDAGGHTPYAYAVVNKYFLTRDNAERWFAKMGAGTGEQVTLFLKVRKSSGTAGRVELEGVKRADGTVTKL